MIEIDLGDVRAGVAGPKRPQDRIDLPDLKARFGDLLTRADATGYGKGRDEAGKRYRETAASSEAAAAPAGAVTGTATMERPAGSAGAAPLEIGHGDV